MKTTTTMLLFLITAQFACAAMIDKTTTEKIKGFCDVWAETVDNPPKIAEYTPGALKEFTEKLRFGDRCASFFTGVSNEMIGEPSWLDDTHKKVVIGNWEDKVTIKQEILIFLDYVNQNPAVLNKPANQILRKSVEAAGIYTYAAP